MCQLCLRLIIANHTDPVTGAFTGLDLMGPTSRPVLPEREPESVTAKSESPNNSPNEDKLGTVVLD